MPDLIRILRGQRYIFSALSVLDSIATAYGL